MNYALRCYVLSSTALFYDDDNNGKHNVWPEEKTILLPLYDYIYTMEQKSLLHPSKTKEK